MKGNRFLNAVFIFIFAFFFTSTTCADFIDVQFSRFLDGVRKEAHEKGISRKTLDTYLTGLKAPRPAPLKEIVRQPQEQQTFAEYLQDFTPHKSIVKGRAFMKKYKDVLLRIEKDYHVQPQYLVALWGFESYYGKHIGKSPIVKTLAALAYQHHRAKFYREQLMAALKMLDAKKVIPEQKISTWDGGMGQPSFEPTTYFSYAVDYDHDGFKNIWTSMPDVFASIANFLHQNNWHGTERWGREVKIPKHLSKHWTGLKTRLTIAQWRKLGVTQLNGKPLQDISSKASLLMLDSKKKGRAFLIYRNLRILLIWNDTYFEAIAVGLLADQIS